MTVIRFFLQSSISVIVFSVFFTALILLLQFLTQNKRKKPFNWYWGIAFFGFTLSLMNILWNTISLYPFINGFQYFGNINLVPVVSIIKMVETIFIQQPYAYSIINLFGNIGFFIPFGFFLPFLSKKLVSAWKVTLYGAILSLFIEVYQLFLPARGSDIDDVILNTLGSLLGFFIFWLFQKLYQNLLFNNQSK
jgi:glycopeptide antibiotics resistance protein